MSSRIFQCGVLALEYRPMTVQELEAGVPIPGSGKELQASLDAARAGLGI
jgi:hypothetical protein